jgi:hypothetical protein
MEEVTASLCFSPNNPNPISKMGDISVVCQESRDNDIGSVRLSNNIQMVDR